MKKIYYGKAIYDKKEINAAIDELRKIAGVIDTNTVIILKTIR